MVIRVLLLATAAAVAPAVRPVSAQTADPRPVTVTRTQFAGLRWLEGAWRGSGGSYAAFFEDFRWLDDSTVARRTFADSTLQEATETSEMVLRNGMLYTVRNGTRGAPAVLLSGDSLQFGPRTLWVRRSNDHWTAILGGGRVVYELRRYRRP